MFTQLLNMSISASWVVLVVILLRLILKKAPKAIHCALWILVAVRLVCPISFESELSLIPGTEAVPENYLYMEPSSYHTEAVIQIVDNPVYPQQIEIPTNQTVSVVQTWDIQWTLIWLCGMCAMLLYAIISYLAVRQRVRVSISVDKTVRLCDSIDTPFILGLLRPNIYLPSELDPAIATHVLAHEQAHLKRRDHWWKPLGFVLLSVYWFNPVLWLAYILLCRDIEQACDERVIKALDTDGKKAYSMALLTCSVPRRMIAACPLAFGEVGVKGRIKSVLNYKKPAFWVIMVAILACIAATVCFLTDPKDDGPTAYEITSDLWIYDASAVTATVWDEDGSHRVYFTRPQIEDICEIIHDLEEHEFVKEKPSAHLIYTELQCDDFIIDLHWDGEYTYFAFDAVTRERITSNRRSVKNEALNEFFTQIMQLEYRLAEGTYVPISAASLYSAAPESLTLIENRRYEVTKDGLIFSDLSTGDMISYAFEWSWKDYREAKKQLAAFISVGTMPRLNELYIKMDDTELKYQHLYDNTHMVFQDESLFLIEGSRMQENGDTNWTVYKLTEYSPYLLPPADYTTFFKDADKYIHSGLAFARSGDCRPGFFSLTQEELEMLHGIMSQMPAEAIRPGSEIKDYYITLSVFSELTYELKYSADFWYCDGEVGMHWSSYGTEGAEYYQVDYAPLTQFLASLMQPERIEFHSVMFDMDHPEYVTYTHDDITISLLKLIPWEYEIVPYADNHTDFGIRCKPEWLDDWLFFGYMQGELVPESTFLHEAKVEAGMQDGEWHYLFESPIGDTVLWRKWPEPWKMLYRYADGGTYYIYNEGAFDERSQEHDGGGFSYIEQSFDFCLLDEETAINRSKDYIFLQEHENPEVCYDAETNNYLITWQKMDSDGYTVVRLGPVNGGILTEVSGTESE